MKLTPKYIRARKEQGQNAYVRVRFKSAPLDYFHFISDSFANLVSHFLLP